MKLLRPLRRGECKVCQKFTLVRERAVSGTHEAAQVCASCVPIDGEDMSHQSHKLAMAGY